MIIEQHLAWKDAVQHQAGAYPDFRPCKAGDDPTG